MSTASAPTASPTPTARTSRLTTVRRLTGIEARLFLREPVGLIFVFAFPALTALIIGNSFEATDPAFGGAAPADYYIAAYLGVVLTAVGLVMLPVHLAAYREQGVLRRFDASHFPSWAVPVAWFVVAMVLAVAGMAALLGTAALAFGIPAVEDPLATIVALGLGTLTFLSIGLLLGLALPNARAAQGVGLALFFPSFLLGGAGPPPDVMPAAMRTIADLVPTSHVVEALQHSWLGIGESSGPNLLVLVVVFVVATAGWIRLAYRRS